MLKRNGRDNDQLREIKITRHFTKYAEGSVLVEFGDTKVICTASVEDRVPRFVKNTGHGWISAEYAMLPRATEVRKARESHSRVDSRNQEIQRLIARALRSVINLKYLGERTIFIDCDVIQADGGTRTASITGAFVAACEAIYNLYKEREIRKQPIQNFISAVSVGIVEGQAILDLCYEEDSKAQVDMNVVMTDDGKFVEIQGTGEESPFTCSELMEMLDLAAKGNKELIQIQKQVLGEIGIDILGMDYEREIVLATGNKGKLREIKEILKDLNIGVLSLADVGLEDLEIEENGRSFEHNALIKAREICQRTGKIAMGDDSGLEIDALDGRPGLYSARYSGVHGDDQANRDKVLEEMKDVPDQSRGARFVCAIGVSFPDGKEFTVRGTCEGKITKEERGTGGFGYDSLFYVEDYDKTFAEISAEEKNKTSHRARALEKFKVEIEKRLG